MASANLHAAPETSTTASAANKIIEGQAYAANQAAADRQAIQAAHHKLIELIRDNPAYCSGAGKQYIPVCNQDQGRIETQGFLPLLGVRFERTSNTSILNGAKASLSAEHSLEAYRAALKNEKDIIDNWSGQMEKVRGLQRAKLSDMDMALQLSRYYQLAVVAAALGDASYLAAQFKTQAAPVTGPAAPAFAGMAAAVKHIAAKFTAPKIFVFPPRPAAAVEITPFGKQFQESLQKALAGQLVDTPFGSHVVTGEYQTLDDGLLVLCQLYSSDFLLQDRLSFKLTKQAIGNVRTEPAAADFGKLFVKPEPAVGGFQGELTTHIGSHDLLFRAGDSVKLYVRLTKPGYFYVVGHVVKPDVQYSYLLDIAEGVGDERFIIYIDEDKTSQLTELGEFSVDAPYGVEYLQLVAATTNLNGKLPAYQWDKKLEYYVIAGSDGNAVEGVKGVRGLKRNLGINEYHESQLVYTTTPK